MLLFITLLLIGCDSTQDDICPIRLEGDDVPHWGQMSALRNDISWPASPWQGMLYAVTNSEKEEMTILMDVFDRNGSRVENLSFHGIPKQTGAHQLPGQIIERMEEQTAFFFTSESSDAGADDYLLHKSEKERFLKIDSYDASTCVIEGTFELTVVRDTSASKVFPYADTLRFSKGRFRTHLVTYP